MTMLSSGHNVSIFFLKYGQYSDWFYVLPNDIFIFDNSSLDGDFHGASTDIIKYIMKPTGPFCPQLTLVLSLAEIAVMDAFFYTEKAYDLACAGS